VELGTLQSLQVGDRGCYVEVRSSDGSLANVLGSFELCDATAAVGQEARLYYEPQTVTAATCQGDPECQDQETVLVLMRAEVIGAAAAAAPGSPGSPSAARPNPVNPASSVIVPDGKYMGVAATGEDVYYHGISFQCGDLPLNDPCWGQPNISYTIGNDEVFGLVDCQAMVLTEAWVGGERVAQNLAPQSPAMAEMLSLACYEALG
jgi:hypothetical protein